MNNSAILETVSYFRIFIGQIDQMKLRILFFSILIAIQTICSAEERPVVIFLNGTSSAGKSSIAKQIQELSPRPFIHTGLDDFALMLPSSYIIHGERAEQGYQFIHASGPSVTIEMGPVAKQLAKVKHQSMKSFLEHGFSIVVDELLLTEEEFQEYVELFQDYRVLFVAIKPPLEVIEEREKARGDRILGLARGHYNLTHQGKTYDLIINSSEMTPEESAQVILQSLSSLPDLRTFQSHSQRK